MNYEIEEMKIRLEVFETARIMLIGELKPETPTYEQVMERANSLMSFVQVERTTKPILQLLSELDTQVGC